MQVESLIHNIVDEVKRVEGVRAVVLGGSRARGTHTGSSDVDLGIYYHPDSLLDLDALSRVATQLDDEHRADVITQIGGWGPWINGGGWLRIESYPVDFLYKDLRKISAVIDDCLQEKVEVFYQPGHPLGFVSSMYLAEVAVCQPLWDPEGIISELKAKIDPYPDALQNGLIQKFAWEIKFSIDIAKKGAAKADMTYVSGCCFRSVMCMLQVLFALNRVHWLNEKGALALANNFSRKPEMFQERIHHVFHRMDATPTSMQKVIADLEDLNKDVNELIESRNP